MKRRVARRTAHSRQRLTLTPAWVWIMGLPPNPLADLIGPRNTGAPLDPSQARGMLSRGEISVLLK